jgi:hypothetical protein
MEKLTKRRIVMAKKEEKKVEVKIEKKAVGIVNANALGEKKIDEGQFHKEK